MYSYLVKILIPNIIRIRIRSKKQYSLTSGEGGGRREGFQITLDWVFSAPGPTATHKDSRPQLLALAASQKSIYLSQRDSVTVIGIYKKKLVANQLHVDIDAKQHMEYML